MKKLIILGYAILCYGMSAQTFTEFKFSSGDIGWTNDFSGVIDNNAKTITFTSQTWVENIDKLPAHFTLDGDYGVKVGNITQESGVTLNDFRKAVVYNIGNEIDYTVKFVSPQASGIPVIKIDTKDGAPILSKEDWTNIDFFALSDPDHPEYDILRTGLPQADRIRGRGNTSWNYPKKPYRMRFREDVSFFGLPARENWVLLAEYLDPTFLANAIAFELGRDIFELPFTCSYQHVQVYLNGSYDGVYGLTEHRQADPQNIGAPGRVKVDPLEGWFVEADTYWDEDPKFKTTSYDLPIMIKSPEAPTDPTNSDNPFYNFVKNDWNGLCKAMASNGFPENGYRNLINTNSFVDYIMANEIVYNSELGWPKSTFAYKDKGEAISMGPLWDFDWAYTSYGTHIFFQAAIGWTNKHDFFNRFFADSAFLAMYKERWNEKYSEIADMANLIAAMGEKLEAAVVEDTKRWKIEGGYENNYPDDYLGEITRMKNWWNNRVAWLNTEIQELSTNIEIVTPVNPLKAWTHNRQLHVTGLTKDKEWKIYDITGKVIYHSLATDEKEVVTLPNKGVYIVQCENNAIKVVFN